MNTFQTLLSLVTLILALCVIVQAIQEVVKSALNTKASVMEDAMDKFMGSMLPLDKIKDALTARGLKITDLEGLGAPEFRQLLNGISLDPATTAALIAGQPASIEQIKDHMAAFFQGALASFQKAYTTRNKLFAIAISAILVFGLNANVVVLFDSLSADSVAQQAIQGNASSLRSSVKGVAQTESVGEAYSQSSSQIEDILKENPVLLRTGKYPKDFAKDPLMCILGLLVMAGLVSLGAPFWNDVLKSMMGVNNALNSKGSTSS